MKPEDLAHLKSLGIEIDTSVLYGSSSEDLVKYTRQKIQSVLDQIERSSKEYATLGEDAISSIIALGLHNTMGLIVQREANSRGHVDLTITAPLYAAEHTFRYLGEAKVWSTKQYCIDGFTQLMGYMTGRQSTAFTIIYFRIQECDDQFNEYIEELLRQKGGSKIAILARYALTSHIHPSTARVEVDHYATHLPK